LGDRQSAGSDYNQSVLLNPQYAQTNYIQNPTTYYSPVVFYNPYYIGGYYYRGTIIYYSPGFYYGPGYTGIGVGIYSQPIRPIFAPRRRHGRFR
jgi:hypothetical protein